MTAAPGGRWIRSGKLNPCPICGRTKDADCRTSGDGLEALCHYGKTHRPPEGLRQGNVLEGGDGQIWAFTKDTKDGRAAHFTIHKPLPDWKGGDNVIPFRPRSEPRKPPEPPQRAPMPADPPTLARLAEPRPPAGSPYSYSPTQRVNRAPLANGGKRFYCEHRSGERWIDGAGPDPWPMFNDGDAFSCDGWPLEVEGEKCAELVAAGGWVGVSQPGHAHSVAQIRKRYEALSLEGVPGIVFLADHDDIGRRRAAEATEAAALAGMPLLVINAGDLWPDLPEGGSIDDAPGLIAEQIAAIEQAACRIHAEALAAGAPAGAAPQQDHDAADAHHGEEVPPEAEPEPTPYQVLGWCPDRRKVWYRHCQTAQIASVIPYGQAELLKLAPLDYWWQTYPVRDEDGKLIRCNWSRAADGIHQAANQAGVFDPDRVRGRGVWIDAGRVVWHLGDRLEVDGREVALADLNGSFHYRLMPALPIDLDVDPLDNDHGRKILQVIKDRGWQGSSDHLHLAGWVVLSNVCGALWKRPALQITSPFGSGKSKTIENVIAPLQGGIGRSTAGSTEAGIRQLIGRDALPCTVDESEAEDGRKREAQLRLVRYSYDGIPQVKGTPNGEAMTFCLRSSLCLAGINAPIDNPADRSRIAVIAPRYLPDDQWAEVGRRLDALITVEIGHRLIRRTVSTLPALLENIDTFGRVIRGQVASNEAGRCGDTYGALLAGAHHLVSTEALSDSAAIDWLDSVGWEIGHADSDDTDRKAGAEGRQCLEWLLSHELRWIDPGDREAERPSTGSLTVRELVNLAHNCPRTVQGQEARTALGRKGIHAMDEGLAVARSASGTMGIFSQTKWLKGGHAARLLEIEGTTRTSSPMRFPYGGSHRAVIVPWAAVGPIGEG